MGIRQRIAFRSKEIKSGKLFDTKFLSSFCAILRLSKAKCVNFAKYIYS